MPAIFADPRTKANDQASSSSISWSGSIEKAKGSVMTNVSPPAATMTAR